jgi:hypothetical protein
MAALLSVALRARHVHAPISFCLTSEVKKCHDIFVGITKQEKDKASMKIRL